MQKTVWETGGATWLLGRALILNGATGSDRSGIEVDQGLIQGEEINVPDQEEGRGGIEIEFSHVVVPDQWEVFPEEKLEPEEALQGEEVDRGADPEDEEFGVAQYPEGHPEGKEVAREVGETDLVREVGETDLVESVQEDHLLKKLSPPASPKRPLQRPKMSRTRLKIHRTQ